MNGLFEIGNMGFFEIGTVDRFSRKGSFLKLPLWTGLFLMNGFLKQTLWTDLFLRNGLFEIGTRAL